MDELPRLIFDMSSIMWTALLVGKDREGGYKAPWPGEPDRTPAQINTAAYGYENAINMIVSYLDKAGRAPKDIIMVFDGESAKLLRKSIHAGYKEGREHHPDEYVQFNKLREQLTATLRELGAASAEQRGMEADDVMAYLAGVLPRSTVVTNDGDMLVLVSDKCDVLRDGDLNVNKYGPFSFKHILTYKSLVGDSGDKIPGARGFGPKTFIELLVKWGEPGLDIMLDLIQRHELGRLVEDVAEFPALQKIIDNAESVYMSYDCARLYPELVNTGRAPLNIIAGKVVPYDAGKHDERLARWYGRTYLGHQDSYDKLVPWMAQHFAVSDWVSFDIEGSSPPESIAWLEEKKRSESAEDGEKLGVDILGMKLAGGALTFGDNQQYTVYFPVDHSGADGIKNVTSTQLRRVLETMRNTVPEGTPLVVHNAPCELSVCLQEWGEAWQDNGYEGMLPNVHDTILMASYENENEWRALKKLSARLLNYDQMTYEEVTQGRRMNELSANETLLYGADDTICTSALYNYYRLKLDIEQTWEVFKAVELDPMYLNAKRYVQGAPISLERMLELEREDEKNSEQAAAYFRDFLIRRGWAGTVCPSFQSAEELTSPVIKSLVPLIAGPVPEGEEFKTNVRTPKKLAALIQDWAGKRDDHLTESFGRMLENVLDGDGIKPLNDFIQTMFKGDPVMNLDSPKQMAGLLYDTLGLQVRLRNKATDAMRLKGIREGNPRTDDLALEFALAYDRDKGEEAINVVRAIQTLKTTATKKKMFYKPYRFARHWKDNLIHPNMIQCGPVTRRYSSSEPNLQQMPKHPKHGVPPKFREILIPHA